MRIELPTAESYVPRPIGIMSAAETLRALFQSAGTLCITEGFKILNSMDPFANDCRNVRTLTTSGVTHPQYKPDLPHSRSPPEPEPEPVARVIGIPTITPIEA